MRAAQARSLLGLSAARTGALKKKQMKLGLARSSSSPQPLNHLIGLVEQQERLALVNRAVAS